MGCFSWITQNSNRSIIMYGYGTRRYPCRTCYMWDNNGRRWREMAYEGYGVFGGKDYYVLLAEMNREYGPDVDEETKRRDGITIYFDEQSTNKWIYPNLTDCKEWTWINKKPMLCPQQGASDVNAWSDDFSSDDDDENNYETRKKHTKTDKYDGWPNGQTKP